MREENGRRCYFDLEDCFRIVQCCLKGLYEAEDKINMMNRLVETNELGMKILYNRLFVHPSRIYILPETGELKLLHPLMVSPFDREQRDSRCYYSPEKMMDFDFEEDEKCSVFELGLSLIHIISLRDCHEECYNGFEVMQDVINDRVT